MQFLTIFYRPFADCFGRKIFLFFSALIMAAGDDSVLLKALILLPFSFSERDIFFILLAILR